MSELLLQSTIEIGPILRLDRHRDYSSATSLQ
jgi:hypothetical protein